MTDWAKELANVCPEDGATLMEVCGTHTMVARRSGIHALLPKGVRLLSGPGCPVCVTPIGYVDHAVALARLKGVTITTFGDLLRVPGSSSSLERERGQGRDVRVIYSVRDALALAAEQPQKTVVFLAVGFETTAPTIAAALLEAKSSGLDNFLVLVAHRLVPPALQALLSGDDLVDGFLAPGHVSTVIGLDPYEFVARDHGRPVVIAGFEAEQMLLGILQLLRLGKRGEPAVENAYAEVVRPEGNPTARNMLERVFEPCEASWRGIGPIPGSGLRLKGDYHRFDASKLDVDIEEPKEPRGCKCGDILRGLSLPEQCPLFDKLCSPEHPVGACMVSTEGACSAAYRYGRIQ